MAEVESEMNGNVNSCGMRLMRTSLTRSAMACASSFVMFIVFLIIYVLDRHLIASTIVFYDGLCCLFLTFLVFFIVWCLACLRPGNSERWQNMLALGPQALLIFVLVGYAFIITIPSLLDRSISLYILSSIEIATERGATKEEINDWFYKGFVVRNGAVDKRLHEQMVTGNVRFENGRYFMTPSGDRTYKIYHSAVALFNTDPRYVIPYNEDAEAKQ